MVAPVLLASKHRTTPTQMVYLSGGTTTTQLGGNVASNELATNNLGFPANRGVWFKGCYFMAVVNGSSQWTIQVYDPVANTVFDNLGVAHGLTPSYANTFSGLFVTKSANPILFFVAHGSGSLQQLFTTTDGRNWTLTATGVGSTVTGVGRAVLYRNQLYMTGHTSGAGGFIVVDPVAATAVQFTLASLGWGTSSVQGSMCVFRNRLFLLRVAVAAVSSLILYEFTGGTWVIRNTIIATNNSSGTFTDYDHFLFPVGSTKMVALAMVDTSNTLVTRGAKAWDLVPTSPVAFSATEKTSTLVPTNLRNVADGGPGSISTGRWTGFVDNDFNAAPGSPQVYIWFLSNTTGGFYSYYEYVDSDTLLGPGATGPNQDYALPYGTAGGGDRTYAAVGLKALVTNVVPSPSPGRVRVTAKVFGDIDPSVNNTSGGTPPTQFAGRRNPCVAATTVALPTVTYSNGAAGVGATLTRVGNGALPLQDNVSLALTQRLLVKNQASAFQNGIYGVTSLGDGSNPFILTRVTDFDAYGAIGDIYPTAWTQITGGDTLANTAWYLRLSDPFLIVGTTALTFAQMDSSGTPLNRRLRIWYSTNETPNMTQATLAGTPTQSFAQAPLVTRNVNALETLVADGATDYTFDWDASADALQNGQVLHIMARAGTA